MTGHHSEWTLDDHQVATIVSGQFPELGALPVKALGMGWDHILYLLGDDEWVFRFPRRAERVPWLRREIQVVDRVAAVLGGLVPRFEYLGEPSEDYPYPFVGYRFVPGLNADDPRVPGQSIAKDVGGLLARLHQIDPAGVPSTPTNWEHDSAPSEIPRLIAVAELVESHLPELARSRTAPFLSGTPRAPSMPSRGVQCLCHNDICAEHLIVDPTTGRLAGLIDWTDAMVTDPVIDFVGLITVGDYRFIADAADHYLSSGGPGIEGGFWERLVWWCRALTLTWLGEALDEQLSDLRRHTEWVERAFAEPDIDESDKE